jgi:hypothetical protein
MGVRTDVALDLSASPAAGRWKVERRVQVQQDAGVVPGHLHDAGGIASHHRLQALVLFADSHQLGEQRRAEQRRVSGPAMKRRHDDRAPSGGLAPLPLGLGGMEERVQEPRLQGLVDRGDEDPLGRRGDRGQPGLDRGDLSVAVAGVVDGAGLPAGADRRSGVRLQVLRVLAEDHDAFLDSALLDLLDLVGQEGLAAPVQERLRVSHALRLAGREKQRDHVHRVVPPGAGPAAA